MTEDFNIRDNDWDPSYSHHSLYTDILRDVADSFGLELLTLIDPVSIQYMDNSQELNSDLDLIFLRIKLEELNNHIISPDLWSPSDHAPLLVSITLEEKFIQDKKRHPVKNSDKEK